MTFPFVEIYDFFAKPFDGRMLKGPVSEPILMKIQTKDGKAVTGAVAPSMAVLPYLVLSDGQEKLRELIADAIKGQDDSFCMFLAHEGHVKLFDTDIKDALAPMLDKGLMYDPTAKHVLLIRIFHRTGVLSGFLPIDKNRVVSYAKPTGLDTEVLHVKVGADQNLH